MAYGVPYFGKALHYLLHSGAQGFSVADEDVIVMGNRFPRIYLVYFFLFSSYFVPVLHTPDFPETYMLLSCIILSCSR